MKLLPLACVLILATACGGRPMQEEYAKLPVTAPDNPGITSPEPASQEDHPVAFIDKTPVMWRKSSIIRWRCAARS